MYVCMDKVKNACLLKALWQLRMSEVSDFGRKHNVSTHWGPLLYHDLLTELPKNIASPGSPVFLFLGPIHLHSNVFYSINITPIPVPHTQNIWRAKAIRRFCFCNNSKLDGDGAYFFKTVLLFYPFPVTIKDILLFKSKPLYVCK